MRRAHPLTYPVARKARERAPKLFARRDCTASSELLFPLYRLGYAQGEPIFHQPPAVSRGPLPFEQLHRVDLSFLLPGALLVQTTRPPMHDVDEGPQKQVERAYTDLEHHTFEAWRPHVDYLARTHARLAPGAQALLREGFRDRRETTFKQKGWGARYDEMNALDGEGWHKYGGRPRSALFLLRQADAWREGVDYLCAFGMDGCTTLVWCYRLARDLEHLLAKPAFVLAELELGRLPERATDLRFCMDWRIDILVHHELEPGTRKPAEPRPAERKAGLALV
jgi:hypothetical protein